MSFSNRSLWVQLRRRLRRVLFFVWGTLIFGIVSNTIANFTTMTTDTQLSKLIIVYLAVTFPIPLFTCLGLMILLTIFSWTGGHADDGLATLPLDQQYRMRMLNRLHRYYEGLMQQSLQGAVLLELRLAEMPAEVKNLVTLLSSLSNQTEQPLPSGTSIFQVYNDAAHELLVLGEPGAGKSTLLVDLAQQLVQQAKSNENHSLPVILPLSTWAVKRSPLDKWIVKQLMQLYNIPRGLSEQWVKANAILPLLDGLDEMDEAARVACIAAINNYHSEHLTVPLVVCSRKAEYEHAAGQQRLTLQNAVIIQPLTEMQVDTYLAQGGEPLEALRAVWHQDVTLRELTSTPLMLSILILTYCGQPAEDLLQRTPLQEQQRRIFKKYVERMLDRRGPLKAKMPQRTLYWLAFLAGQMHKRNQTVFYLEQMQPDWLLATQEAYERWAVRYPGIFMGVLLSLLVNALTFNAFDPVRFTVYVFIGGYIGDLFSQARLRKRATGQQKGGLPGITKFLGGSILIGLFIGLGVWLTVGLAYPASDLLHDGLIVGLSSTGCCFLLCILFQMGHNGPKFPLSRLGYVSANSASWRRRIWNGLLVGFSVGPILGLGTGLVYGESFGIQAGLTYWLTFGAVGTLLSIIPMGKKKKIDPTEILKLSWHSLWKSLLSSGHWGQTLLVALSLAVGIGLTSGLSTFFGQWLDGHSFSFAVGEIKGLVTIPIVGLAYGLTFVVGYWSLLGLFRGLSSEDLPENLRVRPNEGIRRSLSISVSVGLCSGVVCGVISFLSTMLYYGLDAWLGQGLSIGVDLGLRAGLNNAVFVGLWTGVVVALQVAVFGALLVGAPLGGLAWLRHYVLRCLLWRSHKIPFYYSRFLNRATDCILLRKVGGGYMFIHREFQDYIASLDSADDAA